MRKFRNKNVNDEERREVKAEQKKETTQKVWWKEEIALKICAQVPVLGMLIVHAYFVKEISQLEAKMKEFKEAYREIREAYDESKSSNT